MTNTTEQPLAAASGTFTLGDEFPVRRLGYGAMQITGPGIFGEPADPDEARRVQKHHFHTHGTTLAGLMKEHEVDPHDFLEDVHDIPLDRVNCDERLGRLLPRLPGRRSP